MSGRRVFAALSAGTLLAGGLALAPFVAAPLAGTAPRHVAGDFDGDGRVDLAVGAPGGNRVRVVYTHAHPLGSHVAFLTPHRSSVYSMAFGSSLAVGDFNGDGRSDLAVGAPNYATPADPDVGDGVTETRGAIFVFLGSPTGLQRQPLEMTGPYDGDEPYDLGTDLAAADVNGDGRSDLAATLLGTDNGNIRVYRGSASGFTATGYQPLNDFEATSLAFGDVNGDHHPDLIAGSTVDLTNPSDENFGDLMVFHGTAHGLRASGAQKIRGDQVGVFSDLGTAVAAGDVNGDGFADVVAGAAYDRSVPTHPSAGTIVLLTGSAHGLSASRHRNLNEHRIYSSSHDGNGFGATLAIANVSGDRFADVIVGAPTERVAGHPRAGAVYVLRGSAGGIALTHVQRFTQVTSGVPGAAVTDGRFGAALFASDVAGDPSRDLVVGAPNETHGGLIVTLPGTSAGLTAQHATSVGDSTANDRLGSSIR
jgi:hypothetical protein